MRSFLLAGFVAVLLPACVVGTGEITDEGTGGDQSGTNTGGGADEGTGGGDGTGTGTGTGTTSTPRIVATVDKTTVSSELGKTEKLMVTIQSMNGFTGTVNVTPSMLSGATAMTGFTITPNPASVTLEDGASQQVELTVKIPTDAASLSPTLKVDLGGGATTASISSAFTVANQVTVNIAAGTGMGNHLSLPATNAPIRIRQGTKIVFHNADGIQHVIHGNGGIPHENTAAGGAGTDYTVTPSGDATWYCHSHEGSGMSRPVLIVQ